MAWIFIAVRVVTLFIALPLAVLMGTQIAAQAWTQDHSAMIQAWSSVIQSFLTIAAVAIAIAVPTWQHWQAQKIAEAKDAEALEKLRNALYIEVSQVAQSILSQIHYVKRNHYSVIKPPMPRIYMMNANRIGELTISEAKSLVSFALVLDEI